MIATYCWECDAPVRVMHGGWYSCTRCGFESLRDQPSSFATPPDVRHDDAEQRLHGQLSLPLLAPARSAGAGLVSLINKSHMGNAHE